MKKKSIKVTLPPAYAEIVDSLIELGLYRDADEVIRGGVLTLHARFLHPAERVEDLREAVMVGVRQADRGEFDDSEIDDIKRIGRRQLRARKRAG